MMLNKYKSFKENRKAVEDETRSRRQSTANPGKKINRIKDLVVSKRYWSIWDLVDLTIQLILKNDLELSPGLPHLIPKQLNLLEQHLHVEIPKELLLFGRLHFGTSEMRREYIQMTCKDRNNQVNIV